MAQIQPVRPILAKLLAINGYSYPKLFPVNQFDPIDHFGYLLIALESVIKHI